MKKIIFEELFINEKGLEDKRVVVRAFNSNDPIQQSENILFVEKEENIILPDEYFREAWTLDKKTKKLGVNKEKAVIIKANKLLIEMGLHEKKKKLEIDAKQAKALKNSQKENDISKEIEGIEAFSENVKKDLDALNDFEAIKNYKPEGLE